MFKHWELQKEYYPLLKGADLKNYYQFLKPQLDVHDYHENTTHYGNYFYFKEGFVFAWTEVELSEEELDIFRRFTSVLSLTYRRYMDLKEAEAQAREAQTEAALEKVRARTMAMQSSDELAETAYVLYQQFGLLGEGPEQLTIGIIDETQMVMEFWLTLGGNQVNRLFRAPIEEPIALKKSYLAWKEKKRSLVIDISGDDLKAYYNFFKNLPDYKEYNEFRNSQSIEQRRVIHYAFFSKGFLALASNEPKSTETIQLLERFAGVLEQTYTRFLDLQKAEEQAREAQIEAALEKVRSRSLAMHKSEELSETAEVIFEQINLLGKIPDRMGIGIINEESKNVEFWLTDQGGNQLKHEFFFSLDEPTSILKIYNAWKERKDSFVVDLTGQKLQDWLLFIKEIVKLPIDETKIIGRRVQQAAFFSKGFLLLTTHEPVANEIMHLLVRFAKVFDQTYRRFLDLQKAEAQAREAQIEAALERVRSRSMAMHHTSELQDVINTVHQQFKSLDIAITGGAFIAINEENINEIACWGAGGTADYVVRVHIPFLDRPIYTELIDGIQKGTGFFTEEFSYEEKIEFFNHLFKHPPYIDASTERKKEVLSREGGYTRSCAVSKYTNIFIINHHGRIFSEEENNILIRFGKVFEQTYTRFLDLQKAEAQAREAKIEASLERVRSRSMAMHHSEELKEVVAQLFEGVDELGFEATVCNVSLINKVNNTTNVWTAHRTTQGMSSYHVFVPSLKHSFYKELLNTFYKNRDFAVHELYGKEKKNYITELFNKVDYSQAPDAVRKANKELVHSDERIVLSAATLKYGMLVASRSFPLTTEEAGILQRFAKVFEQTYTRFLDLQQAEAQAREAQIEAALERVRSRSMGMQKSEELKEVIQVVYEQFVHLKINVDHAGFVIDYTAKGDWHFWIADEQDIPSKITHPYFESVWANQFNEAKEKGANFFTTNLNFEEKNKFYNELLSYVPGLLEASKDFYLSCPGLAGSTALFDNVSLYIENFSGIPYSDEENKILMRFGKVFQQTYTRFLDLQRAEAQTREAQIENALEKVRSRSLAMHKSDELKEVVTVLFDRLRELNITMDTANIEIYRDDFRNYEFWVANSYYTYPEPFDYVYFDDLVNNEVVHHKELAQISGEEIFTKVYPFEIKNKFWNYLFEHTMLGQLPDDRKDLILTSNAWSVSCVFSIHSGIVLMNYSDKLHTEEELNILKRFSRVFEQAYVRFLDLQKAESQAREAQIEAALEKVRSRTMAMQHSDELSDTAGVLFEQFKTIGIVPKRCSIGIIDKETHRAKMWLTRTDGKVIPGADLVPLTEEEHLQELYNSWKNKKPVYSFSVKGKDRLKWTQYISEKAKMHLPEYQPDKIDTEQILNEPAFLNSFIFNHGFIMLHTVVGLREDDLPILKRFSSVFEQTYTRFLDLQQAEAQAREAQIETALERVRSRTMAMQRSDELPATAAIVFKQLIELGIKPNRLYIGIIKDNSGEVEFWITDEDGTKVIQQFTGNVSRNLSLQKMYEGWKSQKKSVIIEIQGDELKEYFRYLGEELHVPFKLGLSQKRRVQNIAYFSSGFIGIASPDPQPEETNELLKRFAGVFNLTYTRFNDLQQAEAQNKIIQAENDRKTQELEEARQLQLSMLPKELPVLPNLDMWRLLRFSSGNGWNADNSNR
jgi:hypothetical protein